MLIEYVEIIWFFFFHSDRKLKLLFKIKCGRIQRSAIVPLVSKPAYTQESISSANFYHGNFNHIPFVPIVFGINIEHEYKLLIVYACNKLTCYDVEYVHGI